MTGTTKVDVLGVCIDALEFDEAVGMALGWAREPGGESHYIVTPNINHVVLHSKNADFRRAYRGASLVLADGRYIGLLAKLTGAGRVPATINGSDLVPALLDAAESRGGVSVYLLGALEGIGERAAAQIEKRWPKSRVVGVYSPPLGYEHDSAELAGISARINEQAPDVLIVGISPPRQETWIAGAIDDLDVRLTICAGATIDFLAGNKSRAPGWMQKVGLEWVYRVLQEPGRLLPRYASDAAAVAGLTFTAMRRRLTGKSVPPASKE